MRSVPDVQKDPPSLLSQLGCVKILDLKPPKDLVKTFSRELLNI